ncbi:MAG: spore germination protein [Oscillospiraceae bacterium]|nr:spore germination protein [Oscillospiraceae bacterium]
MENTFKITTKQVYTLFLLASFSPLIRLASAAGARLGGAAGWVSIFISCAVYYGFTVLLSCYFKRICNNNADLYYMYKSAFGKIIAKILVLLYALWVFALTGFYLRAFAERFAGAIMPGVPVGFFTVTLLALIFIILSGRFQSFAILSEIFFYIILSVIAVIFAFQLSKIRPENLLPVTIYDIERIINGTLPTIGVFAYITPMLFLFGEVGEKNPENFRKYGLYSALVLLGVNLVIFAVTAGIFGSDFTATMTQPFLTSVKTMGVLDSLERLESVFLLLWVVTDLALIVMLIYVLQRLINLLCSDAPKPAITSIPLKTPLLCGLYIFSICLMRGANETQSLSEKVGLPLNIVLGILIPCLALGVWRLRKAGAD